MLQVAAMPCFTMPFICEEEDEDRMDRAHPPLRRVSRGPAVAIDPTAVLRFTLSSPPSFATQQPNTSFPPLVSVPKPILDGQDSCYSSCSEESHTTLSREPSDTLAAELAMLNVEVKAEEEEKLDDHLVDFVTKLGYSEMQLRQVLAKLGTNVGQDRILAELIKLGGASTKKVSSNSSSPSPAAPPELRAIVIDGSNLAMTHGRKEVFSCVGIRECVKFFQQRGHDDILVFVPHFRSETARADCPITDQHILAELDQEKILVWTPSRRINGRRIVCHDDRYILKAAEEKDAVIVSNDEYRDLVREHPPYRRLVEQRLLMYSFVDGKFMPPDDPLGRHGPKLEQFLAKNAVVPSAQPCPYARKCTYGNKCKYYHPERPNGVRVSVTERLLKENNQRGKQTLGERPSMMYEKASPSAMHMAVGRTQSLNVPQQHNQVDYSQHQVYYGENLIPEPALPPHMHWSGPSHASLARNASAPLAPAVQLQNAQGGHSPDASRAASVTELAPGPFSRPPPAPTQHLFAPSTAVWGQSEFSVGPVTRFDSLSSTSSSQISPSSMGLSDDRLRLQYHLCQLFPEAAVQAVMAAHPDECSPQRLCERILALQRGFDN